MRWFVKALFILFVTLTIRLKSQDTLTVLSYNILNYPISNTTKADTLKPIIKYIQPDIFMITELTSGVGATTILNDALNVDGVTLYQKATYFNGPDTDNMLYYNSDKLVLYSQHEVPTALRNISEYVLYYKIPGMTATTDTVFIYCYMAHLKASQSDPNPQKRYQEAILIKNYMDSRTNIENVFFGGDFNFYSNSTTTEPAYNTILNGGSVALLDPTSSPGNWHNNSFYAALHTQSTRSGSLPDGGSFGGMDDRFDFIFISPDIQTGANGLTYVSNSYKAVGNDGNHFNKSINATPLNNAAPANVIDALYYMSDHLPVVLKAAVPINVGIENYTKKMNWKGFYAQNSFQFISEKPIENSTVLVYDLLGKILQINKYNNTKTFNLPLHNLSQGVYFVKVITNKYQESFKIFKR